MPALKDRSTTTDKDVDMPMRRKLTENRLLVSACDILHDMNLSMCRCIIDCTYNMNFANLTSKNLNALLIKKMS